MDWGNESGYRLRPVWHKKVMCCFSDRLPAGLLWYTVIYRKPHVFSLMQAECLPESWELGWLLQVQAYCCWRSGSIDWSLLMSEGELTFNHSVTFLIFYCAILLKILYVHACCLRVGECTLTRKADDRLHTSDRTGRQRDQHMTDELKIGRIRRSDKLLQWVFLLRIQLRAVGKGR